MQTTTQDEKNISTTAISDEKDKDKKILNERGELKNVEGNSEIHSAYLAGQTFYKEKDMEEALISFRRYRQVVLATKNKDKAMWSNEEKQIVAPQQDAHLFYLANAAHIVSSQIAETNSSDFYNPYVKLWQTWVQTYQTPEPV